MNFANLEFEAVQKLEGASGKRENPLQRAGHKQLGTNTPPEKKSSTCANFVNSNNPEKTSLSLAESSIQPKTGPEEFAV